jgi:hypothetical protein
MRLWHAQFGDHIGVEMIHDPLTDRSVPGGAPRTSTFVLTSHANSNGLREGRAAGWNRRHSSMGTSIAVSTPRRDLRPFPLTGIVKLAETEEMS